MHCLPTCSPHSEPTLKDWINDLPMDHFVLTPFHFENSNQPNFCNPLQASVDITDLSVLTNVHEVRAISALLRLLYLHY